MAKNDFALLTPVADKSVSTHIYLVAPGTTSSINAGEFVIKGLGVNKYAAAFTASQALQPGTGTDYIAGFAMSTSTETSTATGYVEVMELNRSQVFLGNPKTAANFGLTAGSQSQATYNAQVSKRVLIDVTSGVHTVLSTDSANNGLVIEYSDVTQYPGKVAFSLRDALSYKV
jgi:hypothetical protein